MTTLVTPIHLDALFLPHDKVVKEALADYTRLPYTNQLRDFNPNVPYIGEAILNHPFQDKNLLLKAGTHLHWSLPKGLTKTVGFRILKRADLDQLKPFFVFTSEPAFWEELVAHIWKTLLVGTGWITMINNTVATVHDQTNVDQKRFDMGIRFLVTQGVIPAHKAENFVQALTEVLIKPLGSDYPCVPDVWLVVRKENDAITKGWIVESSFIASSRSAENQNLTAVNVPFHDDQHANKTQPFRFMGRQLAADSGWQSANVRGNRYLRELTAVGYNPQAGTKGFSEPTFAAFYPNCSSVFGLFDPDIVAESKHVTYEVIGVYSDSANDYLGQFIADFTNRNIADNAFFQRLSKQLDFEFGWKIAADTALDHNKALPQRMALFGKTTPKRSGQPQSHLIELSIGNTGTEALSAYLATKIESSQLADKVETEELLEAIQFSSRLQNQVLDIGHKFREAQHDKGFTAFPGGTLWNIKMETLNAQKAAQLNDDPHQHAQLPEQIAHLLNTVNTLQVAYDHATRELPQLRRQLYSDWYRYMLGAYPPVDNMTAFFDSDEVMDYIRRRSIRPIVEKLANSGTLLVALDDHGRFQRARVKGANSLAEQLANQLTRLNNAIALFNQQKGEDSKSWPEKGKCLALRPTAAPRYWRPNDPVVLFSTHHPSSKIKGLQNDRHAIPHVTKSAECHLLNFHFDNPDNFSLAEFFKLLQASSKLFHASAETSNSDKSYIWNPFMLEWKSEFLPAFPASNRATTSRLYHPDFVKTHYQLNETDPDFSLSGDSGIFQNATFYTGSTILTPNAGIQLEKNIREFIADHGKEQPAHILKRLMDAQKILAETDVLSQSLGGFHEALIMHKQSRQLDVADPLGFPAYQTFTEEVAPLVAKHNLTAPQPLAEFNPIRSGIMRLVNLRMIDSFGQTVDFDNPNIMTSKTVAIASQPNAVHLKPRLTQPARINFRFLSASLGEQEMNAHPASTPICGWLVPNNLDRSIMFYDQDGQSLGAITMNAANPWLPAPDSGRSITAVESIQNVTLRRVARYLVERQVERIANAPAGGVHFLQHFINALDSAQENIAPDNFAEHQDLAILMGNPIAVVRAKLNLELENRPVTDQSWTQFARELGGSERLSDGFTQVKFPIRLGEHKQFNDGLIGYWRESADRQLGQHYYSSEASPNPHKHIKTYHQGGNPLNIQHAIDDEPVFVTMLVDPKGAIHAASGILPVKSIVIPKDQFTAALKRIAVTFLTAPLLSTAENLQVSLPKEAGYEWRWLEATPTRTWAEIPQFVTIEKKVFETKFPDQPTLWQQLVTQKWLRPLEQNRGHAIITTAVHRAFPPNAEGEPHPFPPDIGKRLDAFFDTYGKRIEPFDLHLSFAGSQIIREGWLRLTQTIAPSTNNQPNETAEN